MARRIGNQTVRFDKRIAIVSAGNIVGPMEGSGPLGGLFDRVLTDDAVGKESYEKAETQMLVSAFEQAFAKCGLGADDMDLYIGGDLLNQITATTYAMRTMGKPYWGAYNACATFGESMQIAAGAVESGMARNVMVSSSSHFATSERQFRTPLEQGTQTAVTAQRTVTGSACAILSLNGRGPRISAVTCGRVVDFNVMDIADMGTAMAPAAASTILAHFDATKTDFSDYDLVLTGDLAHVGFEVAQSLLECEGFSHDGNFNDCGRLIYDKDRQPVDSGGSGAGCSASVFTAYVYPRLRSGELRRVLIVPTGALMSTVTFNQNESIPSIAHAVQIEFE